MKNFTRLMLAAAIAVTLSAQDKKPAEKTPAQATDPVCGMTVDTKTSEHASYKGKTYYFCSPDEKKDFEKDPAKYIKAEKPAPNKKS